jgi:CHAD domain-containing protein
VTVRSINAGIENPKFFFPYPFLKRYPMQISYAWPHMLEREPSFSGLPTLFKSFRESSGSATVFLLDSFDWRLFRRGRLLFCTPGGRYSLFDMKNGKEEASLVVEGEGPRRFCSDFPESPLAMLLRPVLGIRALLPHGPFVREWVLHEFYKDEKTLLALGLWEKFRPCGEGENVPAFGQYHVRSLKETSKAAKKLGAFLEELGFETTQEDLYGLMLEAGGQNHKAREGIILEPRTLSREALLLFLKELFRVMAENIPGIRGDMDTEFLHDFRVASRRMRSLLSQMRTALDAETGTALREGLKAMGQITGELRDLDVFLLTESRFRALLPEALAPGLDSFFEELREKRAQVRERMLKGMDGITFSGTLKDLETLTGEEACPEPGPEGERPVLELVTEALLVQHRRVLRRGRKIRPESPDALFHALRIDCKKLRYLLEFSASLFSGKELNPLLDHLKDLQENLGGFNDLSTQKAFFLSRLKTLEGREKASLPEAAALGGLLTALEQKQVESRKDFSALFKAFAADSRRFEKLLGRKAEAKA